MLKIDKFEKNDYHLFEKKDTEIKGWLKGADKNFFPIIDVDNLLNNPLFEEVEKYINEVKIETMDNIKHSSKRFLITKIDGELCGISLDDIKIVVDEIVLQDLPVSQINNPHQDILMGIAHIHGEIVYVVDTFFMLNKKNSSYKNYVVITMDSRLFALAINSIDTVLSINDDQIESLAGQQEIINKVAKVDRKLISILDTKEIVRYLPESSVYA